MLLHVYSFKHVWFLLDIFRLAYFCDDKLNIFAHQSNIYMFMLASSFIIFKLIKSLCYFYICVETFVKSLHIYKNNL
jgi:hypothetical protein